ncbi:MAG: PAS domain S-box protein [Limisphaerales bacterium]
MNKTRILVVDDDPEILRVFTQILNDAGYDVLQASKGRAGLQLAREKHPDLALLDVLLPDLNGMELCKQIKADPDLRDVFVVLISGGATNVTHKVEGLESGADDYMVKPFDPDELLARIRTIVRLKDIMAALRASEEHHRRLVNILPDAVFLIHPEGRLLAVNAQAVTMLGYAGPEELLGKSAFDLAPVEDHERIKTDIAATLQIGSMRNAGYTLLKNGVPLQVELSATVSLDGNGQAAGLVIVGHDVTERNQAEQKIRQLLELLDHAYDIIIIRDLEGRVQYFNKGAERILGWTADEVRGRCTTDLFFEDTSTFAKAQKILLQTGEWSGELQVVTKARKPLILHSRWTLVRGHQGQSPHVVSISTDITGRKQAEEALRQSQEHYRTLAESAPDAIFILDRKSTIQYVNSVARQWLGNTDAELLGHALAEFFPPEIAREHQKVLQRVFKTGTMARTERGQPFRGTVKWVETRLVPLRNPQGKILSVMVVARDLTEQKQVEKSLSEREEWGRKIISTAMDGFWMVDLEGKIVDVNEAYCRMSGYSREELLSMCVSDVEVNELSPTLVMQHVQRITESGSDHFETRHRRKDGHIFEIEASATFLKLREPRVFTFFRDITERKQAEQLLQASQERFRQLAENIREVFWITNPDKNEMIYISPAYEVVWGRTCESLYAAPTSWVETIHPEDRKRVMEAVLTRQISGQYDEVYRICRPSGSLRWIHDRAFPVKDKSGNVYRVVGIAEDITQQKEMEDTLRQAEARYRGIFEHASEGIFRTTPEGRILIANPALARMFGYPSPQEMMSSVTDVGQQIYVSSEKRAELKRSLLEQGAVQGFEEENYRKDGSIIWVSLNAHVVYDVSGAVLYFEGTIQDITERKRAEARVAMLAHAVESTAEMICITDIQDRFTFVNRAFLRAYGLTEVEILGKTPAMLFSPNNPPTLRTEILEQTRLGGWHGEVLDRRKDGTEIPIFLSTSQIVDPAGRVIGLMGVAQDITERKWAEKLLQTQRDFGTILSSSIDLKATAGRLLEIALENEGIDCGGIFLVDSESRALDLVAHRGFSTDFAKHASHFAADSAGTRPAGPRRAISGRPGGQLAGIVQQLKREGLLAMEVVPVQHSGEVVAVLSVGSRIRAEIPVRTCQVLEVIAARAAGAITRIRAEQSLRANRRLLEKTLHSLRSAVLVVNTDSMVIEECNPATTQIFGYMRDELIGRTTDFLYADEAMAEEFGGHLRSAVEDKGFLSDFEFKMKRKDGTVFPTEHSMMPIRNEVGRLVSWVSVVQDITERKRVDEELRQLPWRIIEAQEAERLRVARDIHDGVNQVIASVKLRLRQVESHVGTLNPAAREILVRCDKLLVQALEENRRIAHNLRPSDLDELGLAASCRNFCKEIQARTNLTVKCNIAPLGQRLPPAVELNLFRIVQEAFTNIEKHARAKMIRLRLSFQGDSVVLRIQDDGRGFVPQRTRTRKGKWRGIGLTNMRERALSLGGACEILSTPKEGTTISVRIPCKRAG